MTLTDEEFAQITTQTVDYTAALYAQLLIILDDRESVSDQRDRLSFYFKAHGATIEEPAAAKSQIFLGSSL